VPSTKKPTVFFLIADTALVGMRNSLLSRKSTPVRFLELQETYCQIVLPRITSNCTLLSHSSAWIASKVSPDVFIRAGGPSFTCGHNCQSAFVCSTLVDSFWVCIYVCSNWRTRPIFS